MSVVEFLAPARARAIAAWRRPGPLVRDGLLATVAAVVLVGSALTDDHGLHGGSRLLWLGLLLTVCAPLVLRRRFPLAVAALCATASTAAAVVSGRDATILLVAIAIGSAAFHTDRRLPLAAGSVAWTTGHALLGGLPVEVLGVTIIGALGLAPVAFGLALRLLAEQAGHIARLKQAREAAARSEERTRIAREVHDVVGHHLSAIRLQAVGGRRGPAGGHPEADRVLGTIADLAHEALGDIRTLLDRLRVDAGADSGRVDPAPVDPGAAGSPGLDDLPALAARLGGDGLRIDVTTDPRLAGGAAAGTGSCAYRIVQEALTNVVRHTSACHATVRVDREDDGLVVTVDDPGPTHPEPPRPEPPRLEPGVGGGPDTAPRSGGLHGMAERAAALGGTVTAGPRGPGWRVRAVLPMVPVGEP